MAHPLSPRIVSAGEGELLAVVGDAYRLLARGEDTGGAYALLEAVVPPGSPGPPPHTHTREEEGFYILDGRITVTIDGRDSVAAPGAFVLLPRHIPHKFRNDGDVPARMLITISPAGFERFFREVGKALSDPGLLTPPSHEEIQRVLEAAPRYGVTIHTP